MIVLLDRTGSSLDEITAQHPTLGGMTALDEGRLLLVEDMNVTLALSAASVLSIPYAADRLLPHLQRAVG